ncbi:AAA family ATPase [Fictibacillus fluitans]|uniref:AAA family ATPase n=1 Tax=Fictibacillus fluitans TaxID=3058422 RepID=A0ABT8HSZ1_9BACL|nr:AAA family ATPase [Fictibacillus sp. NE201]MDN4523889.1 AAA family ATPase [Fictibacillus sp. NE201]
MKIQIIGGSGTGKSTLAKYISEKEKIKWIDTDQYLWKDDTFTENNPIEKRIEMYQTDIETFSSYAVSGSIDLWYPNGFGDRELLVFLSLDETIRLKRLRDRERQRKNQNKPWWKDENGEFTNDFLEWCKTYYTAKNKSDAGTFAQHSYLMKISKSPVLKLDSSQPVEELYDEIIKEYKRLHPES